jgi:NAD-dependent SIR2 family protein deacetylase
LPTGPGAWEKLATKAPGDAKKYVKRAMASAVPTLTHMSFVKLMEEGYLKFLISQNVDGMHRKSGIPPEKLAEVHGNTNLERCKKCKKEYMRDYRVRTAEKVTEHQTGRKCGMPGCGGILQDTIINFGENLPDRELKEGFANGAKADLCLAMGSSLRVTPAADMPAATAEKGGKLVIVK